MLRFSRSIYQTKRFLSAKSMDKISNPYQNRRWARSKACFFRDECAYVVRDYEHERIQILLFPLRSTIEVRGAVRRPADSMPGVPAPDPHSQSASRHRVHPRSAGIRPNLGYACAERQKDMNRPSVRTLTRISQLPQVPRAATRGCRPTIAWRSV